MSWRIAESLKKLREQINAAYPNRDKSSDGSIGDARHSARRSDHNPNALGVVCAIDIDEDLSPSKTVAGIIAQIQISRDPRVKYIIYEGRITVPGDITRWKPYHGVNPHRHHAHISVVGNSGLYDNRAEWNIGTFAEPAADLILEVPATEAGGQQLAAGSQETAMHTPAALPAVSEAQPPSYLNLAKEKADKAAEQVSWLSGTLEKFGVANPLASTSWGTWIVLFLKGVFAALLAVAGFIKDNVEWVVVAVIVVGIVAVVYTLSRQRVAAEKAGLPVETVNAIATGQWMDAELADLPKAPLSITGV